MGIGQVAKSPFLLHKFGIFLRSVKTVAFATNQKHVNLPFLITFFRSQFDLSELFFFSFFVGVCVLNNKSELKNPDILIYLN